MPCIVIKLHVKSLQRSSTLSTGVYQLLFCFFFFSIFLLLIWPLEASGASKFGETCRSRRPCGAHFTRSGGFSTTTLAWASKTKAAWRRRRRWREMHRRWKAKGDDQLHGPNGQVALLDRESMHWIWLIFSGKSIFEVRIFSPWVGFYGGNLIELSDLHMLSHVISWKITSISASIKVVSFGIVTRVDYMGFWWVSEYGK